MKKSILVIALIFLFVPASSYSKPKKPFFLPVKGLVPDAITAIKIAEAVWLPIYGNAINWEKPFKAKFRDGIWYVEGSLPEGYVGGVAYAEISQKSGCIVNVYHLK